MDFFILLLAGVAYISAVLFFFEYTYHGCRKIYEFTIKCLDWHVAILFLRAFWLLLTLRLISEIDSIPIPYGTTIEEHNQNVVLICLIAYSTSLLLAFVADLKYWKNAIVKYDLLNAGEDKHKALILNTATSLGTTVLFAYLLMIQGSVQQIMIEYSPTEGSLNSWQLTMGVAWLACSFASIRLVLSHAIEVQKNCIEKAERKDKNN